MPIDSISLCCFGCEMLDVGAGTYARVWCSWNSQRFNTTLQHEVQLLSPPSNGTIHFELWNKKGWYDDEFICKVELNVENLRLGSQELSLTPIVKSSESQPVVQEKRASRESKSRKIFSLKKNAKDSGKESKEKMMLRFSVTLKGNDADPCGAVDLC
jgi:hypothetical protein